MPQASTADATDTTTRTWVVAQDHPQADDAGPGSPDRPLRRIDAAARRARAGDTVLVHQGIYRERVAPEHGGRPGAPITYRAAPGEAVAIRGSMLFDPSWAAVDDLPGVVVAALPRDHLGGAAYAGRCDPRLYEDFDPYRLSFNRGIPARPLPAAIAHQRARLADFEEAVIAADSSGTGRVGAEKKRRAAELELAALEDPEDPCLPRTMGQVFLDGEPLLEVEHRSELALPGTWMVDPSGEHLLLHPTPSPRPLAERQVELSVRHTCFAPLRRGLGHIVLEGFTIEHGANHWPCWGTRGWPQVGLVSCRSGHHWTIRGCTIRHAKSLGLDIGQEGNAAHCEFPELPGFEDQAEKATVPPERCGHHLIVDNDISDNGHCGIAGIRSWGVRILGNRIERNNREGWTSPWWEFAGIKLHFFFDGLIEGNLVRDNEAHGIWLDNQFAGSRVTRNLIVNNLWSGVNVELGRGPVTIDHNVIALTRAGDGVYGHDIADVLIAHNLLYANANHGVWMAYCTPRVKPEDGCWQIRVLNNIVAANGQGAIGLPLPWTAAGDNHSDHNLLMGHGEPLDEGSGPFPPRCVITNRSHCGAIPGIAPGDEPQTAEAVSAKLRAALEAAEVPLDRWPDLVRWHEHFTLPLDLWQAAAGFDRHSTVFATIRDGLQSRVGTWSMDLPPEALAARCPALPGLGHDYHGRPLGAQPRPGPFQILREGRNRVVLWPVGEGALE